MAYHPFCAASVSKKLLAGQKKDSPAMIPPSGVGAIRTPKNLQHFAFMSLKVLPPDSCGPTIVYTRHFPPLL